MSDREQLGEWLVFRMFQRKRKVKKHGVISNKSQLSCIDLTAEDCSVFGRPPQPTSPSSSEITEVSFNGLDQEESSAAAAAFVSSYSNCCMRKY